jgi:hypothetical protein
MASIGTVFKKFAMYDYAAKRVLLVRILKTSINSARYMKSPGEWDPKLDERKDMPWQSKFLERPIDPCVKRAAVLAKDLHKITNIYSGDMKWKIYLPNLRFTNVLPMQVKGSLATCERIVRKPHLKTSENKLSIVSFHPEIAPFVARRYRILRQRQATLDFALFQDTVSVPKCPFSGRNKRLVSQAIP